MRFGKILITAALAAALTTGCTPLGNALGSSMLGGGSGHEKGEAAIALTVVRGDNSNETDIPYNAKTVTDLVYQTCYTYGTVAFANADGDCKVIFQTDVPEPEIKGLSESRKKKIAEDQKKQLMDELAKVRPCAPEVNTLKAISQLATTYKNSDEGMDKVMLVMNSGLTTTGYLDFTKGYLSLDAEEVVHRLEAQEAIPDLSGVDVIWMYLGQTALPQEELSEIQKHRLQDIWEKILIAGGAKSVTFTGDISSDKTDKGYPTVTPVDVEKYDCEPFDDDDDETLEKDAGEEVGISTTILTSEELNFVGDKAEFIDSNLATAVLKGTAEQMLQLPDNKVYIVGTTATGDKNFCDELSLRRAYAVRDVLVSLGVPESQMIPMGLGCSDHWHVPDIDGSGRQIEEEARKNRKVMIFDVNSDYAEWIP